MTQPLRETSLLDEVDAKPIKKLAKPVAKASVTPSTSFNRTAVRKALTGLYEAAGGALFMFDPQCAAIFGDDDFVNGAVDSWLNLADTNPFVKKMLMKLATTTGWGGVIAAHLPLIMAVASHHTDFGKQMAMFATGTISHGAPDDDGKTDSKS